MAAISRYKTKLALHQKEGRTPFQTIQLIVNNIPTYSQHLLMTTEDSDS